MCSRTSVEDVTENVKLVNAQFVNHLANGTDEVLALTGLYDGVYDALEICILVIVEGIFVQKLFDDVGKLGG